MRNPGGKKKRSGCLFLERKKKEATIRAKKTPASHEEVKNQKKLRVAEPKKRDSGPEKGTLVQGGEKKKRGRKKRITKQKKNAGVVGGERKDEKRPKTSANVP